MWNYYTKLHLQALCGSHNLYSLSMYVNLRCQISYTFESHQYFQKEADKRTDRRTDNAITKSLPLVALAFSCLCTFLQWKSNYILPNAYKLHKSIISGQGILKHSITYFCSVLFTLRKTGLALKGNKNNYLCYHINMKYCLNCSLTIIKH